MLRFEILNELTLKVTCTGGDKLGGKAAMQGFDSRSAAV